MYKRQRLRPAGEGMHRGIEMVIGNRPPSDEEIRAGLAKIRRRRLVANGPFGVVACAGIIAIIVQYISPSVFHQIMEIGLFQVLLAPFIFACFPAVFVPLVGLKCPRCKNYFHARKYYWSPFARECFNCGLRLDGKNIKDAF